MSGWKTYKLGVLIDVKHGFAFKGEFFSDEPTEDILLTPGNFKIGGGFKTDKFKYHKGDYPKSYVLKEGDILITMTDLSKAGDTLGYSAKIPKHTGINYLHNQRLGLVQFKSDNIDPDFLYWVLRTKPYQYYIVGSATGSTVKHTSPTRICSYEFQAPKDKGEQQQIAQILSSLDDKIELNLQINQTLEAIAQAIFKEWFVNFNFPGFDGELVDGLSKGWRVGKFEELTEIKTGKGLKRKELNLNGKYPVIGANGELGRADEYLLDDKLLLTGRVGTLGAIKISYGKKWYSDNVLIMKPYKFFYYTNYVLKGIDMGSLNRGSTQPLVTQTDLKNYMAMIPNQDVLNLFEETVSELFEKIFFNDLQIQTLTQTRDTLLPKLMSGQLEVV